MLLWVPIISLNISFLYDTTPWILSSELSKLWGYAAFDFSLPGEFLGLHRQQPSFCWIINTMTLTAFLIMLIPYFLASYAMEYIALHKMNLELENMKTYGLPKNVLKDVVWNVLVQYFLLDNHVVA